MAYLPNEEELVGELLPMNGYLRRTLSEELASSSVPAILRTVAEVAYERAECLPGTSEAERLAKHAKRVEVLAREMGEDR